MRLLQVAGIVHGRSRSRRPRHGEPPRPAPWRPDLRDHAIRRLRLRDRATCGTRAQAGLEVFGQPLRPRTGPRALLVRPALLPGATGPEYHSDGLPPLAHAPLPAHLPPADLRPPQRR